MSWLLLLIAGLLEVVWAIGLKAQSAGLRWIPWWMIVSALVGSVVLLAIAMKQLPLGISYSVWVGLGVLGTTAVGMIGFKEPVNAIRLLWVCLLVVSIAGLKWTSPPS